MNENQIAVLIDKFNQIISNAFSGQQLTKLKDSMAGYSLTREYEPNIYRKLKVSEGKKYLALIYIYIDKEILYNDENKKAITIKIDLVLDKEGAGFFFGNQYIGNKNLAPINIVSSDEYYFDSTQNKLFKNNNEISAEKILENIYNLHIKPTRAIGGFYLRLRLFLKRSLIPDIIGGFSNIAVVSLFLINGERHSLDVHKRYFNKLLTDDSKNTIRQQEEPAVPEKISFLGYTASKWSLASYSFFNLIIYFILRLVNYKPVILADAIKNNFLTLVYVIFSLTLWETALPVLLRLLINKSSKYYFDWQFKPMKVT